VLRLELGVSPLAETTTLYRSILKDAMVAEGVAEPPVVAGPSLSLVGRREPLQRLRDAWARDPEGGGGMLVVTGEPGVGKTRLAKVFLHDAGVRAPLVVGLARSHQRALPRWLGPFRDALRSLAGTDAALREATLSRLTPAGRRAVARLTPAAESSDMTGETLGGEAAGATAGKGAGSSEALRDYFEAMAAAVRSRGDAHLVLLLDDLHWADPASVGLVRDLAGRAARSGLRLIATARAEPGGGREAVDALLGGGRAVHGIEIVELGRLDAEQVGQAAKGLVPDRWAGEVASFLQARCSGLPLLMAEWVNLLGDEGVLVAREDGLAELRRELSVVDPMGVPALEVLVRRRLELLPDSARRVLAMASVIGQTFDVGLLQAAGNELVEVVEAGLSLLLGRWFVRHLPDCWFESRRERDIVRWSRGVRRGAFEFAHRRVWRIVYDTISPHRRRHLHGAVAQSLARWGAASYHDLRAEDLALHLLASGDEGSAVGPLAIAARQASAFGAPETAAVYLAEAERIRSGIPAESVLV
jgi:predicted ATPase